jgi:hypothetical protein
MGILLDKYTQPEKMVELTLPLSKDKIKFHRPSVGETKTLSEYSQGLESDDKADVKIAAKVLKILSDEFAGESETELRKDLAAMEAPDRAAIVPFYFKLIGIDRDELLDKAIANLTKTTKN